MGTCPGTYTDPVSGLVCLFVAKWETDEECTCEYLCPDGSMLYVDCQ